MALPEQPHLSIGEVLGLLLEEFPDITISKIRFLESQGLIVPERTPAGYRKFYDGDVDRLRFILREQRENYLPLRVIKDRLETPPDGTERPTARVDEIPDESTDEVVPPPTHPSMRRRSGANPGVGGETVVQRAARRPVPPDPSDAVGRPATYSRQEILDLSGLDGTQLDELESFGLVRDRVPKTNALYDEHDLAVAETARGFAEAGIDIRHLRAWKVAAEREAGLFEQRVLPVLRRRSPEARSEANDLLDDLSELGGRLRGILLARALGNLREPR